MRGKRSFLLVLVLVLPALFLRGGAGRADAPRPAGKVILIIHGGAGDLEKDRNDPTVKLHKQGLERALRAGYQVLKKGGTSLDAVEAAIRVLEDDPWFNAGRGAVFTHEGRNELDASIMDGKTKKAGAVAGVTTIKNPISAARAVMEKSKHVLLAGRGAELFALKEGLPLVHPDYFRTEYRWKELLDELNKEKQPAAKQGRGRGKDRQYFGTVGAVALDRHGNLAAGTSTGGMTNKMAGRIGDSPIIGAGTYADNEACGVSCTGHGEFFIRYAVSHDIAARMKYKKIPVQQAADEVVQGELKKVGGEGGVIALDPQGHMAVSFNSERMFRGYVTEDGTIHVTVWDEKPRQTKAPAAPALPRLAVLVVFDQMRADYLTRWQPLFGKGGFARLQQEGLWFQDCNYPYANTVTAAGHASLGTGCSPDKHGIVGNEWYDRAAGREVTSVSSERYQPVPPPDKARGKRATGASPDRLLMPTLGDALKEATGGKARVISVSLKDRAAILPAGKRADGCYWLNTGTGRFVSSTYYGEKLPAWVEDYNRGRPADAWFGKDWKRFRPDLDYARYSGPDDVAAEWVGYKQGRTFPHPMTGGLTKPGKAYYEAVVNSPFGNDLLLGLVKKAIDGERLGTREVPDLLCVSFSSNDLVGHSYGPDSQEVLDVTLRSDQIVKELLDYLDARVGKGNYVVAVSADHGVCPLPEVARAKGKDAGRISPALLNSRANQFLNETFNARGKPANFIEADVCPWVYFNYRTLRDLHLDHTRVEEALAGWLPKQKGIRAAYTRTRLLQGGFTNDPVGESVRRSFYPDRCGDVAVVLKPYYLITSRLVGTTHGTPHRYDTHVPLLFYGPSIPARVSKEPITPQVAAVILARTLGIKPPAGAQAHLPEGILAKP